MTDRHQPGEPAPTGHAVSPAWLQAPWRHRPLLKFLAIWLVASPLGALAVYGLFFPAEHRLDLLAQRGVQTTGVVSRAHPGEDHEITVRFRVAGTAYDLTDTSRAPNRAGASLRLGDRIAVTYDRQDPDRSCACQPHLVQRKPFGLGFLLWFTAGVVGVVLYVTHRRRSLFERGGLAQQRLQQLAAGYLGSQNRPAPARRPAGRRRSGPAADR